MFGWKTLTGKCLGDGGEGQNRTVDTTIFSRMLYQLSYLATPESVRPQRGTLRARRKAMIPRGAREPKAGAGVNGD